MRASAPRNDSRDQPPGRPLNPRTLALRVVLMLRLLAGAPPFALLLALALFPAACGRSKASAYQPLLGPTGKAPAAMYTVGIHPLHNPQRLMEVYGPIVDHLNRSIPGAHFKMEASRNYEEFEEKLFAGHFDFAMPNPYQSLQSLKHGYRIFGKMGDDEDFCGLILVRKDSGIREVPDLKGKAVCYPAATALAATLQPQYYLHTHGLDVNRDIENRYVGSQESSIMNVFRGHVAAGATWPIPWNQFCVEHPEMARQLVVKWKTEPLKNNGWVVRGDIPAPVADRFAQVLFTLHESAQGKAMLARLPISRFEPATADTYRPVQDFLKKFSQTVRPIDY